MCKSLIAASVPPVTAVYRSGVPFRCRREPPRLEPWEGPFPDPTQRLPQHPEVAAERREVARRYRLRREMREREAELGKERRIKTDFPTSAHGDVRREFRHRPSIHLLGQGMPLQPRRARHKSNTKWRMGYTTFSSPPENEFAALSTAS
jgi:hypothetical protein